VKREAEESIDECLYDMKNDPFQKGKNGIEEEMVLREYVWGESRVPDAGRELRKEVFIKQTDRQTDRTGCGWQDGAGVLHAQYRIGVHAASNERSDHNGG